jgi:hypothetical protein
MTAPSNITPPTMSIIMRLGPAPAGTPVWERPASLETAFCADDAHNSSTTERPRELPLASKRDAWLLEAGPRDGIDARDRGGNIGPAARCRGAGNTAFTVCTDEATSLRMDI